MLQPALHLGGHVRPRLVIDKGHGLRFHRVGPGDELAHRLGAPHEAPLLGKVDHGIGRVVELIRLEVEMRREGGKARLFERARRLSRRRLVADKAEPLEPPDEFPFDADGALIVHFGHHRLLLLEPPHQHGCAPVHESLRQRTVKRVRQPVFYRARGLAPMGFVIDPALALRDIGPCADMREAFRQRVDIAIGAVDAAHLRGEPVIGHAAELVQVAKDALQQARVLGGADAAKIGDAADIPQQAHGRAHRWRARATSGTADSVLSAARSSASRPRDSSGARALPPARR